MLHIVFRCFTVSVYGKTAKDIIIISILPVPAIESLATYAPTNT